MPMFGSAEPGSTSIPGGSPGWAVWCASTIAMSDGPTAVATLKTYGLAALAALVAPSAATHSDKAEMQFLMDKRRSVLADRVDYDAGLGAYLEHPDPGDAPLLELRQTRGLTLPETLAVTLAAAVDEDLMTGRAIAYLQSPVGGSRPRVGLLNAALGPAKAGSGGGALIAGAAFRSGLLTLLGEGAPLPERAVSVPLPLGQA